MPFALEGLPPAALTEQDDKKEGDKNDENEKSFKDYIDDESEFESNEPDLIASIVGNMQNYCRVQEAAYWEEEIKDMLKSVRGVQKTLAESTKIEEVFRFCSEEFKVRKEMKSKDDFKNYIDEIEKMDVILKEKGNEEKQAKLSRIQAEEESRNILTTLPHHKTSGGMKINLEEFMRLLNDVEKTEYDSSCTGKANEMHEVVMGERFKEDLKDEGKKEKTASLHQKTSNLKFVERNIQLAKCGRGTLSLTDEEKSRIEVLLADVEHSNAKKPEDSKEAVASTNKNNLEIDKKVYGIDDDTKSVLKEIDEQLQVMAETRKLEKYSTKIDWLKDDDNENNTPEEKGKENEKKGKRTEKKEQNRLKKINQLLNSINSISGEEICPLSEEELKNLIQESIETSNQQQVRESASEEALCPQKLITELVSNAKLLMPKFKYRFDES